MKKRCEWAPEGDPLYLAYHDEEWGVPSHDDRHLFEMLTLEGAQAGLSWTTILRKREGYRAAFAQFDAGKVARFDRRKSRALLKDPGDRPQPAQGRVDREQRAARARDPERSSGASTLTSGSSSMARPIVNRFRKLGDLPAETAESEDDEQGPQEEGFRFVGPTVCYAFMQAVGMVNDHVTTCFRYGELSVAKRR